MIRPALVASLLLVACSTPADLGERANPPTLDLAPAQRLAPEQLIAEPHQGYIELTIVPPAAASPTGYVLTRDGAVIATLRSSSLSYLDADAIPGAVPAPRELRAALGLSTDYIDLSFVPGGDGEPGKLHAYRAFALYGEVPSTGSADAQGRLPVAPVLGFELSRDGERAWVDIGRDTRYRDLQAPAGQIAETYVDATPFLVPMGAVKLTAHAELALADVTYRVRARTASGVSPSSAPATSHRLLSQLTYQWQRSDDGVTFRDLPTVTGPSWLDLDPPSDRDLWYRVMLRAGDLTVFSEARELRTLPAVKRISSWTRAACALRDDDKLQCWGSGNVPRGVSQQRYRHVQVNEHRTCAIDEQLRIQCWPINTEGAAPADGTNGYSDLSIGSAHYCLRAADGRLACGGFYGSYQPIQWPQDELYSKLASLGGYSCGIRGDGRLRCFGKVAPTAPSNSGYVDLSIGEGALYGLRADGVVHRWADPAAPDYTPIPGAFRAVSSSGALRADGTVQPWGEPKMVAPPGTFEALSFDCGIHQGSRKVSCWGPEQPGVAPLEGLPRNVFLGASSLCVTDEQDKIRCRGGEPFARQTPLGERTQQLKALTFDNGPQCMLRADDSLHCFGTFLAIAAPTTVPETGSEPFTQVVSTDRNVCALRREDGRMRCWGDLSAGSAPPAQSVEPFRKLTAGTSHVCGLRANRTVLCWGSGAAATVPAQLPDNVKALTAGEGHTCAVTQDDKLYCWGASAEGQAPSGPLQLKPALELAAGRAHTCALYEDGRIACWGTSYLGEGSSQPTLGRYRSIFAAGTRTCGVRDDDKLVCWGLFFQGQDGAPLITP